MIIKFIFILFCLISCCLADGNNTNILETFKPLPETPKNTTRYYTLVLDKTLLAPDGYNRTVLTINGQYPGPIIFANIGDKLVITVVNRLEVPSSVHWHGIDQVGTNWYDGVPGVTQCLIQPGVSFTYTFTLFQSGTYWYHSHYRGQLLDGLRGPLVIFDPADPNKSLYDQEYAMTLGDWYHFATDTPQFSNASDPFPDSAEISGVGQLNCSIPSCDSSQKYATYKVTKDKKYRFRIINVSAMSHFRVTIDNHPLTIIAIDGMSVKPYAVEILSINIGQRYSVVVTANQAAGNYWIRASISPCSGEPPKLVGGILSYDNVSVSNPTSTGYSSQTDDCRDPDDSVLQPYPLSPSVPQDKNITQLKLEINVTFFNDPIHPNGTINNISFIPNYSSPSIKRVIDNVSFVPNDNAYFYYKLNEPVEILLINAENRSHPFHLHGHTFWIVARGSKDNINSINYNFNNPPFRDTATIDPLSYLAIRYYANNPGVWLIHCHIQWHFEMGMVAQLVEVPDVFKTYTIPQNVLGLCNQNSSSW
ncbi:18064_t:CDS:2 [Acaulospora morrowiae]|uniref:18064_t:CDS:1 n=1 Tax=Acaulospora morrowiae TaxID=94023 RepID=A0A9N9D9Q7_9GLOM|nr:18064_t:CDS:2 [Acaulospora morrowiae]